MTEKNMQTIFGKYLQSNPPEQTEVYELKFTKTKSLRWDSVKEHQVDGLLMASQTGLYHKISDSPIFSGMKTRFTASKPFDCVYFKNIKAYVVIWFYIPRSKKIFHKISIQDYYNQSIIAPRKSFREEDIAPYSVKIIP